MRFSNLPQEVQELSREFANWTGTFRQLMSDATYPDQKECQESLFKVFTEDEIREILCKKGNLDDFSDEDITDMAGRELRATIWYEIDHKTYFTVVGEQIWCMRKVYEGSTEWYHSERPNFFIPEEDMHYQTQVRPLDDNALLVVQQFVEVNDKLAAAASEGKLPWPFEHNSRRECGENLKKLCS